MYQQVSQWNILLHLCRQQNHNKNTRWLKKCPTGQNAISQQPKDFFYQHFRIFSGVFKFSTVPESFTKIFSLLQELQLLQYSSPYFKIMLKKCRVKWNVQCSVIQQLISKNVQNVHPSFHTSSKSLWSSVWPCWSSPAAAGPILTAWLSSVHQCSLAWNEMKYLVVFKHNSSHEG